MNFKKCDRCGCFFTSGDDICQNCTPIDNFEVNKLKLFLEDNSCMQTSSVTQLSYSTGITAKNLNRHLQTINFIPLKTL